MAHSLKQQQKSVVTTPYMGIEITKAWIPSNFEGTVRHYATLPDGQVVSSPIRSHLTKRIRKYFTENKGS